MTSYIRSCKAAGHKAPGFQFLYRAILRKADDIGHLGHLRAFAHHQPYGLPCLEHSVCARLLLDDLARRGGIAVFLGDIEQIHAGIFPVVLHLRVVHTNKVRHKVLRHHHLAAGRFRLRSRRGRLVDVLAQHAPQHEQNEDGQQDHDARQQRF